jgi:hypothetical protein
MGEREAAELGRLEGRLMAEYGGSWGTDAVIRCIADAVGHFDKAPVRTYVMLLVERRATAQLRDQARRAAADPGDGQGPVLDMRHASGDPCGEAPGPPGIDGPNTRPRHAARHSRCWPRDDVQWGCPPRRYLITRFVDGLQSTAPDTGKRAAPLPMSIVRPQCPRPPR